MIDADVFYVADPVRVAILLLPLLNPKCSMHEDLMLVRGHHLLEHLPLFLIFIDILILLHELLLVLRIENNAIGAYLVVL